LGHTQKQRHEDETTEYPPEQTIQRADDDGDKWFLRRHNNHDSPKSCPNDSADDHMHNKANPGVVLSDQHTNKRQHYDESHDHAKHNATAQPPNDSLLY